jgi:MOSC domain-containing protein YiiM
VIARANLAQPLLRNLQNCDRCALASRVVAEKNSVVIRVCQLFISPGHNFCGHRGQQPGGHAIVEQEQVECVAGRGLRGDRFFDHKQDYKGQIMLFSLEVFDALRRELDLAKAQPQATRRNVFVRGEDLNSLIGRQFEIQGVRFEGTEECKPCDWMDHALGPGACAWMRGRGGLRARILTDGVLRREA